MKILGLLPVTICLMIMGAINVDAHAFHSTEQSPYPDGPEGNDPAVSNGNVPHEPDSGTNPEPLRYSMVSSLSELMDAIDEARPGDEIILRDGRYDTGEWLQSHSAETMLVKAKGTQDAPIVISAQTTGGVEIDGPAGFEFQDSAHLVIRGFEFVHDQIYDSISIECDDCQHVRFTQNYFELSESDEPSDWLGITGEHSAHNRIDHNTFANKETAGNFVLLLGSDEVMPQHNRIDHNRFYNHENPSDNGGECLRIGNSAYATQDSMTVVEYNVFEKCNGDAEVISVKSSNNVIRSNVFKHNEGSVVLRHGNENQIDGNTFLKNEGGVRIYGHDQSVTNNYFEDNYGDGVRQTLVIGSGTAKEDAEGSNSEYRRVDDVLVRNNTFVDNDTNIVYGYGSGDLEPDDVRIDGNTVAGGPGQLVEYVEGG